MDFKTICIGACKHIEAITMADNGKCARKIYHKPAHTSVYVDYVDGRKVKIRRGSIGSADMARLSDTLFDRHNTISDMNCDPTEFINDAVSMEDKKFERIVEVVDSVENPAQQIPAVVLT